jgi:predicted PurR-regulated permease PerM
MSVEESGSPEVPRWLQVSAGWSWRLLLVAAAAAVGVFVMVVLRPILLPVFLAVLLSAYLRPVVVWLKARRVPKGMAAGLGVLLFVLVLAGLVALGAYAITDQSDVIADRVEDGADELEDLAADRFGDDTVADARERLREAGDNLQDAGVRGAVKVASVAVEVVTGAFLTLFALFYVLRDGDRMWASLRDRFDDRKRAFADRAGRRAWGQLQGYMYGTAAIAAVDAVLIGVGAWVLSVPSALAIGLLTFALSFVPFVGAVVAGLFAVLLALADGGVGQALAMLGVVVVVQQVESNLLQPIIQSRFVALHPLAIILAVAAGGTLAGFIGVLIAVPVLAVVMSFLADLDDSGFFAEGRLRDADAELGGEG